MSCGNTDEPDLRRISMRLDDRGACLQAPITALQDGRVGWWVNRSTMSKGAKILVPLLTYDWHGTGAAEPATACS
jgi:putative transposase